MHCDVLKVARRRALGVGVRGMLIATLAAALAGCNKTTVADSTGSIPAAYRDRHPITMKEGRKSLTLFVGAGRGGLSPVQRAEVLVCPELEARRHRRHHDRPARQRRQ
jgi:pilus assembly protein CpaD